VNPLSGGVGGSPVRRKQNIYGMEQSEVAAPLLSKYHQVYTMINKRITGWVASKYCMLIPKLRTLIIEARNKFTINTQASTSKKACLGCLGLMLIARVSREYTKKGYAKTRVSRST
jgi:hypothetical protein